MRAGDSDPRRPRPGNQQPRSRWGMYEFTRDTCTAEAFLFSLTELPNPVHRSVPVAKERSQRTIAEGDRRYFYTISNLQRG